MVLCCISVEIGLWKVSVEIGTHIITFRTEVIEMFLISDRLPDTAIYSAPEEVTVQPDVAFADSLKESAEVETVPIGSQCDTYLIAGSFITDDFAVARIANRVGACCDLTVTIDISRHDVACPPFTTDL